MPGVLTLDRMRYCLVFKGSVSVFNPALLMEYNILM